MASHEPAMLCSVKVGAALAAILTSTRTRASSMRLNPPTLVVFFASVLVAMAAIVAKFGLAAIPQHIPSQDFWLAILAYVVLMLGCLLRGL
ncbi:MAG: hypothetical protein NW216_08205 [Hyphomicrobium sp.]|nr:hypothetical protein [Hyphomicrobium sp.]